MARRPRLNLPQISQHVLQRGNNRQVTFFNDQDYAVYLSKLLKYSLQYQVEIHAFVLMTNHVHLLVTPQTEHGVSQLMQALGRSYVRYINTVHERSGTLWEGRFKSSLVDCARYFLQVSRYIELNPVRAHMVAHPSQYRWSSYHHNALDKHIELLTEHPVYLALGEDVFSRKAVYRGFFDDAHDEDVTPAIREALCKSQVLGDLQFRTQIAQLVGRNIEPLAHGGDRKSKSRGQSC